ncbi:hypothetical protein HDU67_009547 [Dinochytrium kinnereticum]|nr:hypothetical protein HDU67_009547 [Dinochytrium kinnereticum]
MIYLPVCGSNGQTYGNECVFQSAVCKFKPLLKVHDGECEAKKERRDLTAVAPAERKCNAFCPFIFFPVCGSNGVTFSNECEMANAACQFGKAITKAHDGECAADVVPEVPALSTCDAIRCITVFEPVCGSDGKTYSNSCFLLIGACKNPSVKKVHDGQCA